LKKPGHLSRLFIETPLYFRSMRIAFLFGLPIILAACSQGPAESQVTSDAESAVTATADYSPGRYFEPAQADSLLLEMMVYIYRKPEGLTWQQRFEPQYRFYYRERLGLFEHLYMERENDEGDYKYFILRPGRQENTSTVRGVGGTMTIEDGVITAFQETFNTSIGTREEISDRGYQIFHEWVTTGSWERFASDKNYVEWPDDRLKYDLERHEWRYAE